MTKELPIGVFDSGIGGLTVANAIQRTLPNESILYFGDTKHLPYGEKSAESIQDFSKKITQFLIKKGCKMIVIACNTASCVAHKTVSKIANKIPVVNVIDPVIEHISKEFIQSNIGVIGTKRTTYSNVYPEKLLKVDSTAQVTCLATPLLAPMIEEGFFNDKVSQTIIDSYLSHPSLENIDTLILACTHYPLIQESIKAYYKKQINIIDSSKQVADYVKDLLTKNLMLSTKKDQNQFFISDYTNSFKESAKIFFQEDISLREVQL